MNGVFKTLSYARTRKYAGSISTGTLLAKDVVPKMVTLFERLCAECGDLGPAIAVRREFEDVVYKSDDLEVWADFWYTLDGQICERLHSKFYFGAHEGDGADFGIWEGE